MAAGARGGITASSNYAYGLALDVVAAESPGEAAAAQARLTGVATAVERHGIAGVKAAAAMIGLQTGSLRRPLVGLPPADDRRRQGDPGGRRHHLSEHSRLGARHR